MRASPNRRPFAIEWPKDERAALAERVKQGVFAVRFDGCRAEVVTGCKPGGTYAWVPLELAREVLSVYDSAELSQLFPSRAPEWAPALRVSGELHLDQVIAGRFQAPAPSSLRVGTGCEKATHLVTGVDAGAYALRSAPTGGKSIDSEGELADCVASAGADSPAATCSAPLRLELTQISRATKGPDCPAPSRLDGGRCAWESSTWCDPGRQWNDHECVEDPESAAAETGFLAVDAKIRARLEGAQHASYSGSAVEVIEEFRADAAAANELFRELQAVVDAHPSGEWRTITQVRQGVMYHRLFSRLRNTRPPELQLFTDEQLQLLATADQSDDATLREKAASARVKVRDAWRAAQQRELEGCRDVAVHSYAAAITSGAGRRTVPSSVVVATVSLASLTPLLGDAGLEAALKRAGKNAYSPGQFVRLLADMAARSVPSARPMHVRCPEGHRWAAVTCLPSGT